MSRPYQTRRLLPCPDVVDIQQEGRKSSLGRLPGRCGKSRSIVSSKARRAARRSLKRADKSRMNREMGEDADE
jgi:hypothetical protein